MHGRGDSLVEEVPDSQVVAPFASSCGACHFCRTGLQTSCEKGSFWDALPQDGGQTQAIRVPLGDGTLVTLPAAADSASMPSLLAISDVLGAGSHASPCRARLPDRSGGAPPRRRHRAGRAGPSTGDATEVVRTHDGSARSVVERLIDWCSRVCG